MCYNQLLNQNPTIMKIFCENIELKENNEKLQNHMITSKEKYSIGDIVGLLKDIM